MAFQKKTWLARQSSFPNRRDLYDAETNTLFKTVIVQRNEGNITQSGDGFTVQNMNGLEDRINNAFVAEHTFIKSDSNLMPNGTYVTFTDTDNIDAGLIPHIYVPMAYSKLVPDSYQLDTDLHQLRVNFSASATADLPEGGIQLKLKVEYDETPV